MKPNPIYKTIEIHGYTHALCETPSHFTTKKRDYFINQKK